MELKRACYTIENFSANANLIFQPAISSVGERRADARKRDTELSGDIPEDQTYENGEEIEVAYEEYTLKEAFELVGLFALVYFVSNLEKFFDGVTSSCGWTIEKRPGSNLQKFKRVIESNASFSFDEGPVPFEYVEELFLARHVFVHHHGLLSGRYVKKVARPRFVKDDKIVFTLDHVAKATEQLPDFAEFVVSRCKPFSKPFP
jgi:hypothetical protein